MYERWTEEMDELIGNPATISETATPPANKKILWWIAIPLVILIAGETIWGSTALLTAPPMWANIICIVAGIGYFYTWTKLVELDHRRRNMVWLPNLWGKFSLVIFIPALLMPYTLRLGIEISSFSFFNATTSYRELLIIGASGGKSWGEWLDVELPNKSGRDPRVRVTPQLHAQYWHISTLDRDCLVMPTQTGRWGVIRVLRPTYWNIPADINQVRENCVTLNKISNT
jgi:hypothetical protein